jgi:Protein of unknown function (DUF2950)
MRLMSLHPNRHSFPVFVFAIVIAALLAFPVSGSSADASRIKQKTFASPGEAATAFINAMKAHNRKELSAIFGPGLSELSSGDEVSDRADREWFIKAYEEKNSLEKKGDEMAILEVGNDNWPLPIPIVKKGSAWYFDTKAGKEEMLNRRVGRNELRVIGTMQAYVAAQREYAGKDRMGDGVYAFAQKFFSTPGKKDGLYWKAKEGEEESPMGPFAAKAAREGYAKKDRPSPFHGYYFRILTAQGQDAPGGAYDYVVNGNMILGFGLIAYPAKYGASGVMTFMVNQEGVVYQKDLGRKTEKAAKAIIKYDPDTTWKKVEQTAGK